MINAIIAFLCGMLGGFIIYNVLYTINSNKILKLLGNTKMWILNSDEFDKTYVTIADGNRQVTIYTNKEGIYGVNYDG